MGQVTIYLDDQIEIKMKSAAKSASLSLSKWVAGIIEAKIASEWPVSVVNLSGAREDFPSVAEIREGYGSDRVREEL
ncbi:MAG: CopG family transcriptional regulator [Kiritimatiellae bacterium]|nr:CopG family transcriptional regulator [Kiritimatiellia bacterium]